MRWLFKPPAEVYTFEAIERAFSPCSFCGWISSWGNAPGMETIMRLRAEGPIHTGGKAVWRGFCAIIDMFPYGPSI